jgi:predicted DNA-binding transcriptional regulator YafY
MGILEDLWLKFFLVLFRKRSMTKSEVILGIILKILHSPQQSIGVDEFKAITGKSKSTYYRYIEELTEFNLLDGEPLLIVTSEAGVQRFRLNKSLFKYFIPEHLESAYFLEAYKKTGAMLKNAQFDEDIKTLKDDVFRLNGKAEELSRKFYHLSKVHEASESLEFTSKLVKALIENYTLEFFYNGKKYKNVHPLTLVSYREALYLIGFKDEFKPENIRKFKLSRFEQIEVGDEKFSYPNLKKWNPEDFFKHSSGIVTGEEFVAEINVYGVSRKVIKEKTFFNSELVGFGKDFDHYKLFYSNQDEFLGQLFVYAQDLEILSPKKLKDEFISKARKALGLNKAA